MLTQQVLIPTEPSLQDCTARILQYRNCFAVYNIPEITALQLLKFKFGKINVF